MNACKSVYDPQEDSTMLERWVRKYAEGNVLDIGTGSGIQAVTAALNPKVSSVLATDVQKEVIAYCKNCIKNRKIKFLQSDLFEKVKGKFDIIIFNPPYLPEDLKLKDLTLDGGKKGYEVIGRFLSGANAFLNPDGVILIVFSSLTKKEKVEEFIKNNLLDFEELERKHIFFEDLYVYLLRKNEFLKKLELKGIKGVKYLSKGHRGVVYTGKYKGKKIAIKATNPNSGAFGRIEIESKWLRRLNKNNIGPKLLFAENNYFAYRYVEGDLIVDFVKKSGRVQIKKILQQVLRQAYLLDSLKIDKEEMHHPVKHIIISKNKPVMIDFERAHYSQSPKNVTQLCQFLASSRLSETLASKGIKTDKNSLMGLAKVYKRNQNIKNFRKIAGLI
ncbi:methyltransferase [Candidatus Woesearchaeota archaeon]|nr:methyltransferase [Candidatus Woesearchaeota archaeon]